MYDMRSEVLIALAVLKIKSRVIGGNSGSIVHITLLLPLLLLMVSGRIFSAANAIGTSNHIEEMCYFTSLSSYVRSKGELNWTQMTRLYTYMLPVPFDQFFISPLRSGRQNAHSTYVIYPIFVKIFVYKHCCRCHCVQI